MLKSFPKQLQRRMTMGLAIAGVLSLGFDLTRAQQEPPTAVQNLEAMVATSKAFRVATQRIEPSLVSIESFGGVGAKQGQIGGIRSQGEGNTTGVIISSDGYILTSTFNFLQNPPIVTVRTHDGEKQIAKLLGRDDTRKVCLLKIDTAVELPVPEMVPSDQVRVGQWVITVGVGYGDVSPAISMGIISAKNRIGGRALQTDANVSPANYGGPLLDLEGRMLGICVPMNPQSQAAGAGVEWYDSGIGFAVPVTDFQAIIDRLKDGTLVLPGFIGIASSPNPNGDGLLISNVIPDSAASKAGLKNNDIVLSFNDQPVNDMLRLRQLVNRYEAGDRVNITYLEAGQTESKTAELLLGPPPAPTGSEDQLEPPKIR